MMFDLEKHLIELADTPGVSGYEAPIRKKLEAEWAGLCDNLQSDALGNLIATVTGSDPEPRKKILITAHMDEIGMMVTRLDGAFLRVTNVGGIDRRILLSQPVTVHGKKPIPGLVGSRPPHVLSLAERRKYPALGDLVIDTGLTAKQLAAQVKIGDIVTFATKAMRLGKGKVTGKAMDNRASLAMLTELLHTLKTRRFGWDVLIGAAVQEEVGRKGAGTLAWQTQPDLAIVIDVGWAIGQGVGDDKGFKLGEGPTLGIGPNMHPKLYDLLKKTAKQLEIKIPDEVAERDSGTDAFAVQVSRDGVPTALFSIPIRNMHTPVEIVALKDIKRTSRIITEFIVGLDETLLEKVALGIDG